MLNLSQNYGCWLKKINCDTRGQLVILEILKLNFLNLLLSKVLETIELINLGSHLEVNCPNLVIKRHS